MSEQEKAVYGIDFYLDWVEKEGLLVTEDYGVDLFTVPTAGLAALRVQGRRRAPEGSLRLQQYVSVRDRAGRFHDTPEAPL